MKWGLEWRRQDLKAMAYCPDASTIIIEQGWLITPDTELYQHLQTCKACARLRKTKNLHTFDYIYETA